MKSAAVWDSVDFCEVKLSLRVFAGTPLPCAALSPAVSAIVLLLELKTLRELSGELSLDN